jgi:hypothetical protein
MRCRADDEGLALRRLPAGEASNHLMLRWLMTVVVSDEEKTHVMRPGGDQEGERERTTEDASKRIDDIETGEVKSLRDEPGGCPLTGQTASGLKVA